MRYSQRRRYLINLGFLILLVLFTTSFLWSFYLQKENNQTIDRFYRSTNWYAHSMLSQSDKFLYHHQIYHLNGIDIPTFKMSYDLLWSRLDAFLHSNETLILRSKHPIIETDVTHMFATIQSMESDFDITHDFANDTFKQKVRRFEQQLETLNYDISPILSSQISQGIRTNNDLIQLWQIIMFITSLVLATALLRFTQKSYHQARLDTLTQLGNRRVLNEYLDKCLKKKNHNFMVVALDLKRFKHINDTIGYHIGDQVLTKFAQHLQQSKNCDAFRLGGDEFVVVVNLKKTNLTPLEWAKQAKQEFEFCSEIQGHTVEVKTRLGIALRNNEVSSDKLLEQAIFAMNQTKQRPDSDIVIYEEH